MAAVSHNSVNPILRKLCDELCVDEIRELPDGLNGTRRIEVRCGNQAMGMVIADYEIAQLSYTQNMGIISRGTASMERNSNKYLDVRHNAVEDERDIRMLLHHAHEQGRKPTVLVISPQQYRDVVAASKDTIAGHAMGDLKMIYGMEIREIPA